MGGQFLLDEKEDDSGKFSSYERVSLIDLETTIQSWIHPR